MIVLGLSLTDKINGIITISECIHNVGYELGLGKSDHKANDNINCDHIKQLPFYFCNLQKALGSDLKAIASD